MNRKLSLPTAGRQRLHTFPLVFCKEKGQNGSVLIGVIAMMVVLTALGAALLPLSSTSDLNPVHANFQQKAYYLAESGYRYAASVFLHAGDAKEGQVPADVNGAMDDRDDSLAAMHGNSYPLQGSDGNFGLYFRSYYYKSLNAVAVNGDLTATPFGVVPFAAGINKPGYLKVGETKFDYHYNTVSVAANSITFNGIDSAVEVGRKVVFPVCRAVAGNVADGGDLVFQANTGCDLFPPRNGWFTINNSNNPGAPAKDGIYLYKMLDTANNQFTGITSLTGASFPLSLVATDYIVNQRFTHATSTGRIDNAQVVRDVDFFLSVVARRNVPGVAEDLADPLLFTFEEPDNDADGLPDPMEMKTGAGFGLAEIAIEDGDEALHAERDPGNPKGVIVGPISPIFEEAWNASQQFLSYDVQVKIKVKHDEQNFVFVHNDDFYMPGISVRLNTLGTGQMKYLGISYIYTRQDQGNIRDKIDDALFLAANDANNDKISDQPMLILWEFGPTGVNDIHLLAYALLDNADHVIEHDVFLKDWSTLVVRVQERQDGNGRYNDIRVYYADEAAHGVASGDPLDNDRMEYPRNPRIGPANLLDLKWPVDDVSYWGAANDRFTLVQWAVPVDNRVIRVSPAGEANAVLRVRDDDYVTNFVSWDTTRPEVGLHAFGGNTFNIFFDDFAVRFPKSSVIDSPAPGFQEPVQQ